MLFLYKPHHLLCLFHICENNFYFEYLTGFALFFNNKISYFYLGRAPNLQCYNPPQQFFAESKMDVESKICA